MVAGVRRDAADDPRARGATRRERHDPLAVRAHGQLARPTSSTGAASSIWPTSPATPTTRTCRRGRRSTSACATRATSGSGTRPTGSVPASSRRSTGTCPAGGSGGRSSTCRSAAPPGSRRRSGSAPAPRTRPRSTPTTPQSLSRPRWRPARARPRVTSSACSRSAPTGRPEARRVIETLPRSSSATWWAVASPVVVGLVASTTSVTSASLARATSSEIFRSSGSIAVDRRERPAEHVVEPAVLVGALDRDHVGGLLDDADQRAVAPRVLADLAARALGEVEADLAEADLLLHLADRVGERRRVGVLGAQDVKGEPLRGPLADPRELRQLGDQAVDRLGVHGPGEASGRPGPTHG